MPIKELTGKYSRLQVGSKAFQRKAFREAENQRLSDLGFNKIKLRTNTANQYVFTDSLERIAKREIQRDKLNSHTSVSPLIDYSTRKQNGISILFRIKRSLQLINDVSTVRFLEKQIDYISGTRKDMPCL
jgi:hypothetical protein